MPLRDPVQAIEEFQASYLRVYILKEAGGFYAIAGG